MQRQDGRRLGHRRYFVERIGVLVDGEVDPLEREVERFIIFSKSANIRKLPEIGPTADCFESTAECAVLRGLRASLEKQLAAPFKDNHGQLLDEARKRLSHHWDRPTPVT